MWKHRRRLFKPVLMLAISSVAKPLVCGEKMLRRIIVGFQHVFLGCQAIPANAIVAAFGGLFVTEDFVDGLLSRQERFRCVMQLPRRLWDSFSVINILMF